MAANAPNTNRGVTVTVAASDSIFRTRADYVCTGTDDGVLINQAIDQISAVGGTVQLLGGTYSIHAAQVVQPEGVTLQGEGMKATIIQAGNGHSLALNAGLIKLGTDVNAWEGGGLYNLSLIGDGGEDGVTARSDLTATVDGIDASTAVNIRNYQMHDVGIRFCHYGWNCEAEPPNAGNERSVYLQGCELWYNDIAFVMGEHARFGHCDIRWNDIGVAGEPYDATFTSCWIPKNRIGVTGSKSGEDDGVGRGVDNCDFEGGLIFQNEEDNLVLHEGNNVTGLHFGVGEGDSQSWVRVTGNSNQITGCRFLRQTGDFGASIGAVYVDRTIYNLGVAGCYFENFAGPVLAIKVGAACRAINFNNNNIRLGSHPIISQPTGTGAMRESSFCNNVIQLTAPIAAPLIELFSVGAAVGGNLWNDNTFSTSAAGDKPIIGAVGQGVFKGDMQNSQFCNNNLLMPEFYSWDPILDLNDDTGAFIAFNQGFATPSDITTTGDGSFDNLTATSNLDLPDTISSTTGVIEKGNVRFIHNYQNDTGAGGVPEGFNLFVGIGSGNFTTGATAASEDEASYNVGLGYRSLLGVTTGYQNTALGADVMKLLTTGYANTAIGYQAMSNSAVTGLNCMAVGVQALYNNADGHNNIGIGYQSLLTNISSGFNVAIGSGSCQLVTSANNVGIGHQTLKNSSSGGSNTAVGRYAGFDITTGGGNTILGDNSGRGITTGSNNTILGAGVIGSLALANTVIIANGAGTQRIIIDSSGNTKISGDVTGANYTEIEADGTLEFHGAATVWDDLQVNLSSVRVPAANAPTWTAYKGGYVLAFSKAADEIIYFTAQLPHSYHEGEDIDIHLHLAYPNAGTGDTRWNFTHSWANRGDDFPGETTVPADVASPNDADNHQYAEIADLTGSGKTMSSMILCSLEREGTDGVNDDYDDVVYLTAIDFHFPKNTVGSRSETSK